MYSHDNRVEGNDFRVNCYGFLNHLVRESNPEAYWEVERDMFEKWRTVPVSVDLTPCPFHYASFCQDPIRPHRHWAAVTHLGDIQPGDIMGFLPMNYVPKKIPPKGLPQNHLMLIESVLHTGKDTAEFTIIDCTRKPHSENLDSRKEGGIGRSFLQLTIQNQLSLLRWDKRNRNSVFATDSFFLRLKD